MKTVAQNRRALFDLDIVEKITAGIVLTGQEVKSCRMGQASLLGSYVSFLHGTPILKQMKIPPYRFASGIEGYDPNRDRILLLSKAQIARMEALSQERGMTLVPLTMIAGKCIKLELGVGRGRKRIDKRQRIRERETERRLRRGDAE